MIRLYYSEDQGLLDNQIHNFKSEHQDVRHTKNPSASDLELMLIQRNLDGTIENLIIEHYSGSLDVLDNILFHAGISNVLILLSYAPKGQILGSIDNSDCELKKLNDNTKKGYLNALLSGRYSHLKIPKGSMKEIKERIPPCASSINSFLENISLLGETDENVLLALLGSFKKKFNFFDFMKIYLDEDRGKWIYFFNMSVICDDTFRQFSYSLSYQLLELKRYLSARRSESSSKKISSIMKIPLYVAAAYKKLFERYGEKLEY